jgi:hypothetical protein
VAKRNHSFHILTSLSTGKEKLRYDLLSREFNTIKAKQEEALAKATNITINMDGVTTRRNESVMGVNAITSDRVSHLLCLEDVSLTSHDSETLKGGWI